MEAGPALARAIAGVLGSGRFLEVGVGTGRIAGPLRGAGIEVVGVDLSRPMMERARARGITRLVRADAVRLPFRDGTFTVAMTTHLLHLLADWRAALAELCRVSREYYLSLVRTGKEPEELPLRPRAVYRAALGELGVVFAPAGIHERDLTARLEPDRQLPLGEYERTASLREMIESLETRSWSASWKVEEAAHRAAMERVRARFPDERGTFSDRSSLALAVWSTRRLTAWLEGEGSRGGGALSEAAGSCRAP